jgi:ubiquinone/menaquinone biosynthesis C-methylase UbiE
MKPNLERLAGQFRSPTGLSGLRVAAVMRTFNRPATKWTVECLGVQPADVVLEIGFGPGVGIGEALARATTGRVYGIDLSPTMVRMASRANRAAVRKGRAVLMAGDAASLPYGDALFDKVFAVNVIYFWHDPSVPLSEIRRTMKPGGSLALFLLPAQELLKVPWAHTEVFRKFETGEVIEILKHAGYRSVRGEERTLGKAQGACVLATR